MRIATWNLQRPVPSARSRQARIAEHVHQVAADVWVLTETHDSVTPGAEYCGLSTDGVDRAGSLGERWTTIWSRFPIEPLQTTSDPVRAVAVRVVPPIGTPLAVYGTVLPWLGSSWRGIPSEDGRAFAAALEVQASDWRGLRASHADHDLLVCGDFNQDLSDKHYYGSAANRERLRAALELAGLKALTGGENDPVQTECPTRACIDHICLSANALWRAVGVRRFPQLDAPDKRVSDHFGVVIELEPAIIGSQPATAPIMSRRG